MYTYILTSSLHCALPSSGQVHRRRRSGLEPVRAVVAVERAAGALAQFGEEAGDQADALRLRFATDQDGSFARTATIDRLDLAQSRLPILPIGPHIRVADVMGVQRVKCGIVVFVARSEEHTSELQSLMRISYAV